MPAAHRILCVEPRLDDRRVLCATLAAPGRTLECVGAVAEALELLASHPGECDLLFVSDELPATDALALVEGARHGAFRGSIVVLSSALTAPRAAAFRAFERTCVLEKPVPPGFLRAAAKLSAHRAA